MAGKKRLNLFDHIAADFKFHRHIGILMSLVDPGAHNKLNAVIVEQHFDNSGCRIVSFPVKYVAIAEKRSPFQYLGNPAQGDNAFGDKIGSFISDMGGTRWSIFLSRIR
jgi:hypothetical protein